jgi:choline-sulfatase
MLEACGLLDSTVVVFTADHGENLGSHGLMGKTTPNDESARIPMVFAGPGIARGHVSDTVASLVDLAPSFIEAAGSAAPSHMPGRALNAALGGAKAGDDNVAFFESNRRGCGVRFATTPSPSRGATLKTTRKA